jgi:hypothetical protein
VFARALADAAKVYPENGEASIVQRGSGTKHNFIVHRAAAKWMRMKDQGHALRFALARLFQNCF